MTKTQAKQTAVRIIQAYNSASDTIKNAINESPEPLRAMMYKTRVVDANSIDGTDEYHAIVDELEQLY